MSPLHAVDACLLIARLVVLLVVRIICVLRCSFPNWLLYSMLCLSSDWAPHWLNALLCLLQSSLLCSPVHCTAHLLFVLLCCVARALLVHLSLGLTYALLIFSLLGSLFHWLFCLSIHCAAHLLCIVWGSSFVLGSIWGISALWLPCSWWALITHALVVPQSAWGPHSGWVEGHFTCLSFPGGFIRPVGTGMLPITSAPLSKY